MIDWSGIINDKWSIVSIKDSYQYKGQSCAWYKNKQGYVFTRLDRPDGTKQYLHQHQLEMMKYLGRDLFPNENIHHVNGIKDDNNITNLQLWYGLRPTLRASK